jgi:hypothetical protein
MMHEDRRIHKWLSTNEFPSGALAIRSYHHRAETAGLLQSRNRRFAVTVPVASGVEARYGSAISFHLRTGLLYDDGPFRDLQPNVLGKLLR